MSGRNEFYDDQSFAVDATVANYGATELPPEDERFARTEPVQPSVSTTPLTAPEMEYDSSKTEIADAIIVNGKSVVQTVGWMVCIKGACKGVDFHLHSAFNYMGNNQSLDICIPDPKVSRKAMATVAFDAVNREFTLMRCEGTTNIARCNGAALYTPIKLNIYDVITLGDTQLMFVPLCGEKFAWEDDE